MSERSHISPMEVATKVTCSWIAGRSNVDSGHSVARFFTTIFDAAERCQSRGATSKQEGAYDE